MTDTAITSLINLGTGGAVIIVTIYFLRFIQARDKDWQTFFTGFMREQDASLRELLMLLQAHDKKTDVALASMGRRVDDQKKEK